MPNGGKRRFYKDFYDGRFMSETLIIRELIRTSISNYRAMRNAGGVIYS